MSKFDLIAMARRARNVRRKAITLRDIAPPAVLATDLYRAVYAPVVALWTRTAERVIAEYERSLSAITTDAPVDVQALLDQADGEFQRLLILLNAALSDWSIRVESWQRGKWRGAVLSATGVDLGTLIGPEDARETLEQYIEWNTALVKDVSAQARQRIGSAAFTGLTQRLPARDVAKQIREATGMARDRSQRIAADQLSKLSSALAAERRRDAGLTVFEWRHSRKLHGRVDHIPRDGKYYSESVSRVGTQVDGKTVQAAPPKGDRPGEPPYCGCRELSVLIFE